MRRRRRHRRFPVVAAVAVVGAGVIGLAGTAGHRDPSPPPPHAGGVCFTRGDLPDPVCTPGATNPAVTQANIKTTICTSGWSTRAREAYPTSRYSRLKTDRLRAYGYGLDDRRQFELDHLIPISLGGAIVDPANLWPEFDPAPNPKDKDEGQLRVLVCAGKLPLATAQQAIARDWHTAIPRGFNDGDAPADSSD